ncbi:MAG TPA: hypothetical protein VH591_11405 [Ktedonobacterales bacterium]|jgi:hypothetical protein
MSDTSNLTRKLGIVPGGSILLLDAPAPSAALLRDACPPGVTVTDADDGETRFDLIFLWLQAADGLAERFAALQWRIMPDGAIWVMLLKKPVARQRGVTLTWETMQTAALQTDLVDNKGASFSDEEYGTRFVIRRERRPAYATQPSNR